MKIFISVIIFLLSFLLAKMRVNGAKCELERCSLMEEIALKLEKNFKNDLESVYNVCARCMNLSIADIDSSDILELLEDVIGSENDDFLNCIKKLSFANFDDCKGVIINMKEKAAHAKSKAEKSLSDIKACAYVFYPGISMMLILMAV